METGNRKAFLSTVARGDPEFRAAQRQLFDDLSRLPLAVWDYEIVSDGSSGAFDSLRSPRSSVNVWTPHLSLRYRYAGFDQHPVSTSRYLTFARGPRGWRVTDTASGTDRRIWDLGSLDVVRTDHALVLGVDTSRGRLREIARRVDRAVPVVSRVWGTDWSREAVVLVPGSEEQAGALSPDQGSLAQIAAVATVVSGPAGVPPPGSGDRVIVNPANFSELSVLGRRVVLRHELTHVATRAFTDSTVPMWLVEGFADYVGYQGVELPARSIAPELSAAVRAGRMPRRLPTREEFSGMAQHLTRAYESAWLACELIAERYGEQRLVRLYRVMGSGRAGGDPQRHGLRSVLGMTPDEFAAAWRSYVRARLG